VHPRALGLECRQVKVGSLLLLLFVSTQMNSPKMGPVDQICGMGYCTVARGQWAESCRRELLYFRTPGTVAVQYCSSQLPFYRIGLC
jgi:hypothetical protein